MDRCPSSLFVGYRAIAARRRSNNCSFKRRRLGRSASISPDLPLYAARGAS
jgi:hypothetical protein